LQEWNQANDSHTKNIGTTMFPSLEWMDNAACTGAPTNIFFPDKIGDTSTSQWDEARTYCEQCTVRLECLKTVLVHEQESGMRYGMWGGTTPNQRHVL